MEEEAIVQQAQVNTPAAPKQEAGSIVGKLQNEITTKSFDPTKYNGEQLGVINELLQQGVLKGPPLENIIQTFQTTREKLAKEKAVSANTVVFNNLVNTVGEWQDFWEVPAGESWHNRFF